MPGAEIQLPPLLRLDGDGLEALLHMEHQPWQAG